MTRNERMTLQKIETCLEAGWESWKVRTYIQGLGVTIDQDGYAWIGDEAVIDLRFDSLKPKVKYFKK